MVPIIIFWIMKGKIFLQEFKKRNLTSLGKHANHVKMNFIQSSFLPCTGQKSSEASSTLIDFTNQCAPRGVGSWSRLDACTSLAGTPWVRQWNNKCQLCKEIKKKKERLEKKVVAINVFRKLHPFIFGCFHFWINTWCSFSKSESSSPGSFSPLFQTSQE